MSISRSLPVIVQGPKLAVGMGLILPRSYYEEKLALQQVLWRSSPRTLANVRTLEHDNARTKEYYEKGQAIIIRSRLITDNILLFDSRVRYGRLSVEPMASNLTRDKQNFGYDINPELRAEFLRNIGMSEHEEVGGIPLVSRYGVCLQLVV